MKSSNQTINQSTSQLSVNQPAAELSEGLSGYSEKESALIERWHQVCDELTQACQCAKSDNQPSTFSTKKVILLAVSKTKLATMIETLARAGQQHFGENYLQEAIEKIDTLKQSSVAAQLIWHYIGHIQRNKTRDIAERFDWVQTIERDIIARRLSEQRPECMAPLNVLIQVNIDREDSKSGCLPEQLPELIHQVKVYPNITLRGLMIIPARDDTDAFARTKALFDDIGAEHPDLVAWDTLSMGMSGDMSAAIAAGSTMVRVGTAIFGARDG
ncbi:MAG: YggS family pyridoxal phosphate-dependent enzyme [Psychrobacter sp.]|nr:YggS family pyridoxal phosphate-dependent enzyme [Psychrobacter sp.]